MILMNHKTIFSGVCPGDDICTINALCAISTTLIPVKNEETNDIDISVFYSDPSLIQLLTDNIQIPVSAICRLFAEWLTGELCDPKYGTLIGNVDLTVDPTDSNCIPRITREFTNAINMYEELHGPNYRLSDILKSLFIRDIKFIFTPPELYEGVNKILMHSGN